MNKATKQTWLSGLVTMGAAALFLGGMYFHSAPASAAPASAETKAAYEKNCKKCHGWDGKGQTAQGKKLNLSDWTSADVQKKMTDADMVKAILEGKVDPKDPKRKMKGYKDDINEAQAKELVKAVRSFATTPGPFPGEK